ncbi:glycolipid transfer protein 1 [Eucalyptus grandis]|uniref:Uncharacterized protein n=2 Tax=Eucalyptus grandis TaxID=71139 RepID=A0ACC3JLP4_EUCGR|nr:glycolipid transfer protein 1 [Eucalyptus grandis]KAK3414837.1 hypothetical protein EUGRSUZ_H00145 [Eucalyptus grandis]
MEGTAFTRPLEELKHVRSKEGEILTKPFIDVCKMMLPVIDKFGAAMAAVKADVGGNLQRLEKKYLSSPSEFNLLYGLVRAEVASKTAKSSSSCTNALLWLTRAMDFLVELFHDLLDHPDWSMTQACTNAYSKSLKKWHNWLATSSFSVAMKLVPDRKKFLEVVGGSGDLTADMRSFCEKYGPLLQENHKFLASVGLDNMKGS